MMSVANAIEVLDRVVPISDFNKGKAGKAFARAEKGEPIFVVKRNVPTAVILSFDEYRKMQEELEDAQDYRMAVERINSNDSRMTYTTQQVMEQVGVTQNDLDALRKEDELEIS
jgi:prevent-host-death family protein